MGDWAHKKGKAAPEEKVIEEREQEQEQENDGQWQEVDSHALEIDLQELSINDPTQEHVRKQHQNLEQRQEQEQEHVLKQLAVRRNSLRKRHKVTGKGQGS